MSTLRARAERLLRRPVRSADLALAFDQTVAATVDVQVGGRNFFPPMLQDIGSASSSVHINQFGFRPGAIGDQFAAALLAKASEGVAVRLVVDAQGSRPDGSGREFYERLLNGGVDVRVVHATRPRARSQPTACGRGTFFYNMGYRARTRFCLYRRVEDWVEGDHYIRIRGVIGKGCARGFGCGLGKRTHFRSRV